MSPLPTGRYSKGISGGFDEEKRYLSGLVQRKIPWVDADENMKETIRREWIRRVFQVLVDSSSPNDGFKCVGDNADNDFLIMGGPVQPLGGGRLWVGGHPCLLRPDVRFVNLAANIGEQSIHAKVTAVGVNFVEDSSANFVVDELVGRVVVPDVTNPAAPFTITSNTATRIFLSGDPQASGTVVGSRYRVNLSTPVSDREDAVYINVSLDEIDGDEDPEILHDIGANLEAQRFLELQQVIFVREDVTTVGEMPTTYTDADGNDHYVLKIATITRFGTVDEIAAVDVEDLRKTSGDLTSFVRKVGDTMTGDLELDGANVTMVGAETVDGRDVSVDGAKLDTIDWTSQGVASKLKLISWPWEGPTLTAVATQTVNVSKHVRAKVSTTTDTAKGIFTNLPYNRVEILKTPSRDEIIDATKNRVFGRLTLSEVTLAGVLDFTFGSPNVVGLSTTFTTQVNVGDVIQGADGVYYEVLSIADNLHLTLNEQYLGPTALLSANRLRRRWTLSFVSNNDGAETNYTPPAPVDIAWAWHEVFDEADRPVINPIFGIPSDQLVGDMPTATTTLAGKTLLATDAESIGTKAVAANDSRLGAVKGSKNGGTATALNGIVDFVEDGDVQIAVAIVSGRLQVKIKNTAPSAGGGLALGSGTPNDIVTTPLAGDSALAAPFNHRHKLGSEYAIQTDLKVQTTAAAIVSNANLPFKPRFAIVVAKIGTAGIIAGIANATQQASVALVGSGVAAYSASAFAALPSGPDTWTIGPWPTAVNGQISAAHTAGTASVDAAVLTVGDVV